MSRARLYLDHAPGESRGVVTLDGLPERLLIRRIDESPHQLLGARLVARVRRIERGLSSLFLDVGEGPDAVLGLNDATRQLTEGTSVEVEITAESRRDKGAVVRLIGAGDGPPRLSQPAPDLATRLKSFAPDVPIGEGEAARAAADIAEAAALSIVHSLADGGSVAIEPTRALTAIDIDLGQGGRDPRRGARRVNLAAIAAAARLLRLKSIGGLIVIDLVGAGHDGAALAEAAKAAFAPDQPGVSIGPVSRFGLLQLALPWRDRPLGEVLCDPSGAPSERTLALRMLRALEREGRADGGVSLEGRCSPGVLAAAAPYIEALGDRIGRRFVILPAEALPPDRFEVFAR